MDRKEADRKAEAQRKRREELEIRIGNTVSGYNWLRRIEQIGKGQTTRFERVRKESE